MMSVELTDSEAPIGGSGGGSGGSGEGGSRGGSISSREGEGNGSADRRFSGGDTETSLLDKFTRTGGLLGALRGSPLPPRPGGPGLGGQGEKEEARSRPISGLATLEEGTSFHGSKRLAEENQQQPQHRQNQRTPQKPRKRSSVLPNGKTVLDLETGVYKSAFGRKRPSVVAPSSRAGISGAGISGGVSDGHGSFMLSQKDLGLLNEELQERLRSPVFTNVLAYAGMEYELDRVVVGGGTRGASGSSNSNAADGDAAKALSQATAKRLEKSRRGSGQAFVTPNLSKRVFQVAGNTEAAAPATTGGGGAGGTGGSGGGGGGSGGGGGGGGKNRAGRKGRPGPPPGSQPGSHRAMTSPLANVARKKKDKKQKKVTKGAVVVDSSSYISNSSEDEQGEDADGAEEKEEDKKQDPSAVTASTSVVAIRNEARVEEVVLDDDDSGGGGGFDGGGGSGSGFGHKIGDGSKDEEDVEEECKAAPPSSVSPPLSPPWHESARRELRGALEEGLKEILGAPRATYPTANALIAESHVASGGNSSGSGGGGGALTTTSTAISHQAQFDVMVVGDLHESRPRMAEDCLEWHVPCLRRVAISSSFGILMMGMILANTVVLAMDRYPIDQGTLDTLEFLNFLFSLVFVAELLVKLPGLGVRLYLADGFNRFDLVIVLAGVVELPLAPPFLVTGVRSTATQSGLSALRVFRVARIFKLARGWTQLQQVLVVVANTLGGAGYFAVLLFLFMFIYALLGRQFFANRFYFDVATGRAVPIGAPGYFDPHLTERPRSNFDSFIHSIATIFQVLTGEDWQFIMYDAMRCAALDGKFFEGAAAFYFVSLVFLGNYIMLNLFLAIILGNFGTEKKSADDVQAEASEPWPQWWGGTAWQVRWDEFNAREGWFTRKWNVFMRTRCYSAMFGSCHPSAEEQRAGARRVFCCVGRANPVRRAATSVVSHRHFDNTILVFIVLSTVGLALDNPLMDPRSPMAVALFWIDLALTVIFFFEMVLKIASKGLVLVPTAYLHDPWNILDFVIVIVSVVSTAISPQWALQFPPPATNFYFVVFLYC